MTLAFELSLNALLNLCGQMSNVGDRTFTDFAIVTIALANKGRDDTIPVLDPLDVHLGRYRSIRPNVDPFLQKNERMDLATCCSQSLAVYPSRCASSRPNPSQRSPELQPNALSWGR
ncbi:MAG: hypothetical protein AAFN74_03500, partial [Myxococcota bacterium]